MAPIVLLVQRRWRLFTLAAGGAAGVVLLAGLVWPRRWESSALVLPRQPRASAGLLGAYAPLASLLGSEGAASPAFLAELALSRDVLLAVIDHPYPAPGAPGDRAPSLVPLLAVSGNTPDVRRESALRALQRSITTGISLRSGLLRVTVRARDPQVAQAVNQRLLAVIDSVNRARVRSQASEERRFAESRADEASQALFEAERDLQRYEERNRGWRQSPATVTEYGRRQREVSLRQGAYTTLAQAAEQARLDEVREAPAVSIVEAPSRPVRPVSRHLAILVPVGAMGGVLLALVGVAIQGSVPGRSGRAVGRQADRPPLELAD